MSNGGDTPGGTERTDDDWFDEPRTARAASPDDWTAAGPPRDPRRDLGRPVRDRLSRRATIVTILVLAALVAAGVVLAFIFTGGEKKRSTPPATLPTTTRHTTTTKKPTTSQTPAAPTVTLKPGDKGGQVKRLQRFLRLFGYSTGTVDGIYGPATTEAVKRFQQATNLTADGIAGPATLRAIKAALGKAR
jgi:Putative peptidoglycan binding domain